MVPPPENFEESAIYQAARELRRRICQLSHFLPHKESFNLADQMRQLALDITNNIAAGPPGEGAEKNLTLYSKAQSSLLVMLDNLNLCLDEGYYPVEYLLSLKQEAQNLLEQLKP